MMHINFNWFSQSLIRQVIDDHAPLKKGTIRNNQIPYTNSQLRKAINVKKKNMPKRKFYKYRRDNNWNKYRSHRNYVVKLRKLTQCEITNGNCFWKTVKPLLATKSDNVMTEIILMENNVIGNDPGNFSNVINEYCVNITRYIGNDDPISIQSMISLRI